MQSARRGTCRLLVVALLLAAGCLPSAEKLPTTDDPWTGIGAYARVRDITTPGGARCVALYAGSSGVALSCDWP